MDKNEVDIKKVHVWQSLVVAIICFIFEVLLIKFLIENHISLVVAFMIHFVVLFGIFVVLEKVISPDWDRRFLSLTLLFVGCLGPFGAFVSLVTLLLFCVYAYSVDPITNLIAAIMPRLKIPLRQKIYERIIYGMEDTSDVSYAVPFLDIMTLGTENQKIVAIDKMLRFFRPEFIPAFKVAANDKNNAIRVMAATAISHLEANYHENYIKLKRQVEEDPNNGDLLYQFARHCEEYADSEFFDLSRVKMMREEAVVAYEKYLQLFSEDYELEFHLASLYIKIDKVEKAELLLKKMCSKKESFSKPVYLLLMNLYFSKGKYGEMRTLTEEHSKELKEKMEIEDSPEFNELIFSWLDMDKQMERASG